MLRRTFVRTGGPAAGSVFAGSLWQGVARAAAPRHDGPHRDSRDPLGPYGPLAVPDENGVALPVGFGSRIVARTGRRVGGVLWHPAPDGGACFPDGDGWVYVSNSEIPLLGGATAIRFGPDAAVRGAYRILSGTDLNRAGGATPWNTWLSCEEVSRGRVFECDPYGVRAAMPRLAMGRFRHEAAACDPDRQVVYMTEDEPDGCLYRFRPVHWGDLTTGRLEVLCSLGGGAVTWRRVPNPAALLEATRHQVDDAVRFDGGEGCHYSGGVCFLTTKGDNRVWGYDAEDERLEIVYDAGAPLNGVDDITGSSAGDLYVAEDGGNMEINLITPDRAVTPFLRVEGHPGSEITGPAFSPGGDRLYFSSQRGTSGSSSGGITYCVTGPFRT
jgi:hypothetical protein